MEDLKNKQLFKLMWLPNEKSIIWDMKDESQVESASPIYNLIQEQVDLEWWVNEYSIFFNKWLYEDSTEIYDLSHEINTKILSTIKKINNDLKHNFLIFYWFDKDRTNEKRTSLWIKSPISGDTLIDLGQDYHYLNRLVSLQDYLVLPKYD